MWLASDGLDVAVNGIATSRTSPKPWPGRFGRRATAAGALADVSELDDTKRKILVANEPGSLGVLVANVGIVQEKTLFEVTPEDFGRVSQLPFEVSCSAMRWRSR